MWIFYAVPDKMIMVYAMVFGAHLLPYSWLYDSLSYRVFAIAIPIVTLVVGCAFSPLIAAVTMLIVEIIFTITLIAADRKIRHDY